MKLTRREAFYTLGGGLAGLALYSPASATAASKKSDTGMPDFWTPHKLDPEVTARRAYDAFYAHGRGCCYGVFASVIGQMGEKYGAPYDTFPLFMMKFGYSGVSNWGSLCGSLMGAAAMYGLFYYRTDRDPMINTLYTWYEESALPVYSPPEPVLAFDCRQTVAESVLCHNSVSRWAYKSGHDMHSPERSERCARITADVARKAVEILNAKIDGTFAPAAASASTQYCGTCHGRGKEADFAKGKMNCKACHDDKFEDHP